MDIFTDKLADNLKGCLADQKNLAVTFITLRDIKMGWFVGKPAH